MTDKDLSPESMGAAVGTLLRNVDLVKRLGALSQRALQAEFDSEGHVPTVHASVIGS